MTSTDLTTYGLPNAHAIAHILRGLLIRCLNRASRMIEGFTVNEKPGSDGRADYATTLDTELQGIYVKAFQECFPGCGIIAEEGDLVIPCALEGISVWLSCDGICGTRALVRRESNGIATTCALLINGIVESAYIGNVMSREIYGFRPGSENVWRIHNYEHYTKLNPQAKLDFSKDYLVLRDRPERLSLAAQQLTRLPELGGPFRDIIIDTGSIGLTYARLFSSQVGALLLPARTQKPWDYLPTMGMAEKLNIMHMDIETGQIVTPDMGPHAVTLEHDTLVFPAGMYPYVKTLLKVGQK